MSHMPQKLHLARSMSTLGLWVFSPSVFGSLSILIASFGHARLQIWQPVHLSLSRLSL